MLRSYLTIITILLTSLLIISCEGFFGNIGNTGDVDDTTTIAMTINGVAIDGYLSGSTVGLDCDESGEIDASEPSTETDSEGNFEFINPSCVGSIVVTEGTDVSTVSEFEGILRAPSPEAEDGVSSVVVTPITTIVQDFVASQGYSASEAADFVSASLGLSGDLDILKDDHLALASSDDLSLQTAALATASRSTEIMNIINTSTSTLGAIGETIASEVTTQNYFSMSMQSMANSIANGEYGAGMSDSEDVISDIIEEASERASFNNNSNIEVDIKEAAAGAAQLISEMNEGVKESETNAMTAFQAASSKEDRMQAMAEAFEYAASSQAASIDMGERIKEKIEKDELSKISDLAMDVDEKIDEKMGEIKEKGRLFNDDSMNDALDKVRENDGRGSDKQKTGEDDKTVSDKDKEGKDKDGLEKKDGENKDDLEKKDGEKKDGEKKDDLEKKDGEKKDDLEKKDGEKKDGEKKDDLEKKDGEKKDGEKKDGEKTDGKKEGHGLVEFEEVDICEGGEVELGTGAYRLSCDDPENIFYDLFVEIPPENFLEGTLVTISAIDDLIGDSIGDSVTAAFSIVADGLYDKAIMVQLKNIDSSNFEDVILPKVFVDNDLDNAANVTIEKSDEKNPSSYGYMENTVIFVLDGNAAFQLAF
ncbi:MAG: hypothetical protein ABIA04_06825 [Pseudomonadota bacterium]